MPLTPNFSIAYPDGSTTLNPLQQHFASLATSVDTALTTGLGGAPRLANSDAERLALFPSPVQGNLVQRPDKGWLEQYYDVYNAGTNPGGALTAGWYPLARQGPICYVNKNIGQNTINGAVAVSWSSTGADLDTGGMYNASQNTRITVPITGWYDINSQVGQSGTTAWTYNVWINGVIFNPVVASDVGAPGSATRPRLTGMLALNAGDYVETKVSTTTAGIGIAINQCFLSLEWVRPRQV